MGLSVFLNSFKKGSKSMRRVLYRGRLGNKQISTRPHVISYLRITELQAPETTLLKKLNGGWNFFGYPNKIREFIFKFNSNTLGINTRLAHFVDNRNRLCTFCVLNRVNPSVDETFLHLFFECNTTSAWLHAFERKYYPELVFNNIESRKKFWFLHELPGLGNTVNLFITATLWIFKFLIWEAKLKKGYHP